MANRGLRYGGWKPLLLEHRPKASTCGSTPLNRTLTALEATPARRRSRDLTRAFEKAMRGSGVRGTQFTLLATLVQTGPIPTTRLAEFQGLERTTLTRTFLVKYTYLFDF